MDGQQGGGIIFFGFGAIYAFGVAPSAPEFVGVALAFTSPLCLIALISLVAKKSRAPFYSLIASLGWLLVSILSVLVGVPAWFGIPIGMAMVGFAIVMFLFLIPRLVSQPEGGEQ
jgi:hypothetical protein